MWKNDRKEDRRALRSVLTVLHYRIPICLGTAFIAALISALPLYRLLFPGKDIIQSGWDPLRGESASSIKATIYLLLLVGVFTIVFNVAMRGINNYVRTKTGEHA